MIFISSHSHMTSDKASFETKTRVTGNSGNTDMVYFYQELTTGPESITLKCLGGWTEQCLWTNYGHVCAQMHILGKPQPHTCTHTYPKRDYEYPNALKVVCGDVWDLAGCRKWQRSEYWHTWGTVWKRIDKTYCGMKIRLDKTRKYWSHSWRHPQRSISDLDSSTTWKLISFVTSAKQSQQTKEKKCF